MTIAILPARLANQIAAGEVVERPASVIKELIENSLDAGATNINIDIDKGGVKKIRLSDNGIGIAKAELVLALSRHATSKIKNLSDLEAICSLGFRGEALASISSVSRLILTSKPKDQETAWQASAQGRDMDVVVQPAAHPNGTTIEVLDLFFNTPARRKFLRTEKTEFNHIDEVVRRIALARFDVAFTLIHNGKVIRQYRAVNDKSHYAKRVAMICGNKFVESAIEIDCQHDNMILSGWLAKPSFFKAQNDLSYSYVNGRMMRDKLINHAIRQAYANLLPDDTYPAFVLFLQCDHREVDVNVHPAKHEVRFHQSRYVHDFIYSVCNDALSSQIPTETYNDHKKEMELHSDTTYQRPDYVTPLQQANDIIPDQSVNYQTGEYFPREHNVNSPAVSSAYQQLMTPATSFKPLRELSANIPPVNEDTSFQNHFFFYVQSPGYGVFKYEGSLRAISLFKLAKSINLQIIEDSFKQNDQGLVSQPLLLPIVLSLSIEHINLIKSQQALLDKIGIVFVLQGKNCIQIRQFPALLREKDVNTSFIQLLDILCKNEKPVMLNFCQAVAEIMVFDEYNEEQAQTLVLSAKKQFNAQFVTQLVLNSNIIDLISILEEN